MDRANLQNGIDKGDTVAYSRLFLQSTGQLTGDAPFARGTVTALTTLGSLTLAEIAWAGDPELPEKVNVKNLCPVRNGMVIEPA